MYFATNTDRQGLANIKTWSNIVQLYLLLYPQDWTFQNKSALLGLEIAPSHRLFQEASWRCLYLADMTAVTDRRQLHGHQEGRGREGVMGGQRVTGMPIGMPWAAARGASRQQDKDWQVPGEPWQWTTGPVSWDTVTQRRRRRLGSEQGNIHNSTLHNQDAHIYYYLYYYMYTYSQLYYC